jgi:hypothetical protein
MSYQSVGAHVTVASVIAALALGVGGYAASERAADGRALTCKKANDGSLRWLPSKAS